MTENQKEQIIKLRSLGQGLKEIAQQLGISVNTVKTFCRRKNVNKETAPQLAARLPTETTLCVNCGQEIRQMPKQKKRRFCSGKCRQECGTVILTR